VHFASLHNGKGSLAHAPGDPPSLRFDRIVIDGDLVTGRTGGHCHLFARAIIDMIAAKEAPMTKGKR